MVTNAWIEKEEKETEMKLEWLTVNGYDEVKRFSKISKKNITLPRMTPLTVCLCLNIMILKITSSAIIIPT